MIKFRPAAAVLLAGATLALSACSATGSTTSAQQAAASGTAKAAATSGSAAPGTGTTSGSTTTSATAPAPAANRPRPTRPAMQPVGSTSVPHAGRTAGDCPPAPESYPGKLVQITAVTTTGGQVSISYQAAAWECDIKGHEFYAASGPTRHAIVAPTAPIDAITYAGHGTARHQITAAQLHDWLAKHDFAFFGMKLDSTGTAVALKQLYNA